MPFQMVVLTPHLAPLISELDHLVRAIGFSSFVMNWLGVDEEGNVKTPVYTYAQSGQSLSDAVERLRVHPEQKTIWKRTGTPWFHSSYAAARILERSYSEAQSQEILRWTTVCSYMISQWMGVRPYHVPVSYSEASWTGMLDLDSVMWSTDVLNILSLNAEALPPLCDFCDFEGSMGASSPGGRRWKALCNVKIFLAVGDGACANMGSGSVDQSSLAVTVGTSAAVRMVVPQAWRDNFEPNGLWLYRISKDKLLYGGAISDGGYFLDWFLQLSCCFSTGHDWSELEERAMVVPIGSSGVTALPFLSGERASGESERDRT